MPGPYIYSDVDNLEGTKKVGTEQCAALVQHYSIGIGQTKTWKEGIAVRGNDYRIEKGTAIATFVNGKYPNKSHGNHVAYYVSQDSEGITVMDQWAGKSKPKVSSRKLYFKGGKRKDGTYLDASNNGDAFSVIM